MSKKTCLFILISTQLAVLGLATRKSSNPSHSAEQNIKFLNLNSGTPFPMPQQFVQTSTQHFLDSRAFSFQHVPGSVVCDLLSTAFNRYYKIIFRPNQYETAKNVVNLRNSDTKRNQKNNRLKSSLLKRVQVKVLLPCEDYPSLESDESCNIKYLCYAD